MNQREAIENVYDELEEITNLLENIRLEQHNHKTIIGYLVIVVFVMFTEIGLVILQ